MIHGYLDIHSHILPGVDDGSQNMDMTIEMIDTAYSQGVRTIIATPHYYCGHKNNSGNYIQKIYNETVSVINRKYKDFNLLLGNEIYFREEAIEKLKSKEIFTLADTRYILIEFSPAAEYKFLYNAVQKCVNSGYCPILAHIERYACLYKKEDKIRELICAGAYMQVNAENFKKRGFFSQKSFCMKLLQKKLVHFLGSDCHNMDLRSPDLGPAIKYMEKKTEKAIFDQIIKENPMKLLENRYI